MNRRPFKLISTRDMHDLTQEEVASGSGISRSMYAMIEAGRRNGTYKTIKKIADFFKMSVDELFDDYFFDINAHDKRHFVNNSQKNTLNDSSLQKAD